MRAMHVTKNVKKNACLQDIFLVFVLSLIFSINCAAMWIQFFFYFLLATDSTISSFHLMVHSYLCLPDWCGQKIHMSKKDRRFLFVQFYIVCLLYSYVFSVRTGQADRGINAPSMLNTDQEKYRYSISNISMENIDIKYRNIESKISILHHYFFSPFILFLLVSFTFFIHSIPCSSSLIKFSILSSV